jgi:hypothetical protein
VETLPETNRGGAQEGIASFRPENIGRRRLAYSMGNGAISYDLVKDSDTPSQVSPRLAVNSRASDRVRKGVTVDGWCLPSDNGRNFGQRYGIVSAYTEEMEAPTLDHLRVMLHTKGPHSSAAVRCRLDP